MKSISQINGKTKTYSLSELTEVINRKKIAIANYIRCGVSSVYESITLDGKVLLSGRENGKHVIMLCKLSKKDFWLETIETREYNY